MPKKYKKKSHPKIEKWFKEKTSKEQDTILKNLDKLGKLMKGDF